MEVKDHHISILSFILSRLRTKRLEISSKICILTRPNLVKKTSWDFVGRFISASKKGQFSNHGLTGCPKKMKRVRASQVINITINWKLALTDNQYHQHNFPHMTTTSKVWNLFNGRVYLDPPLALLVIPAPPGCQQETIRWRYRRPPTFWCQHEREFQNGSNVQNIVWSLRRQKKRCWNMKNRQQEHSRSSRC